MPNFFDQFDAPPAATAPPSPAGGGNFFDKFDDPKAPAPSPEDQGTTVGGIAASIGRGLAPVAAGGAVGAALGAPFAGVGAIPGAAAGAAAAGLTQLGTSIYNPIARATGLPESPTPQEMTDKLLDKIGVRRPASGVERVAEATAGGAGGTVGPARFAGEVADRVAPGVVKRVAEQLAKGKTTQAISGAAGGAAGQGAAEAGGGPLAQYVASLLGGSLPYGGRSAAPPRQAAVDARQAGYVLPPSSISEKPGLVSSVLAGWGGKIKTQQEASSRNQSVTNELAAEALGLPKDTVLTEPVFQKLRQAAGQAYENVKNAIPSINSDAAYDRDMAGLTSQNSQAAQMFPKITANPGIRELVDELKSVKTFPTGAGVELVKELRFNANANLRAIGDPSKHALGIAQRQAADAVDSLMERNIAAAGNPDAVAQYRAARQLIAKSYDIEGATNSATGDVNAHGLARLAAKGRPLTGQLDTIANAATAFPKMMQAPAGFGHPEAFSALDFFGSAAALGHGNPSIAGAIVARPLARSLMLSKPYQGRIANPRPPVPLPLITNPGYGSIVQPPTDPLLGGLQ